MAKTPPPGTPPGGPPKEPVPYQNPFRDVTGLRPERVDMGVDYGGAGPVYALGPGVITGSASGPSTGWGPPAGPAPGGWISERLSAGPLKGAQVYVAEGIVPGVSVGQRVTSGTVIGQMVGGIETGFAAPGSMGAGGETLAASLGQQMPGGDPGGWPSAAGVAYNRVLVATGAPSGTGVSATVTGHGSNPSWLDRALADLGNWLSAGVGGVAGGAAGGIAGAISGLGQSITTISDFFHTLDAAVMWLLNPTNWVRIVCDVTGGILVLGGIVAMSGVGSQIQSGAGEAVGGIPFVGGVGKGVIDTGVTVMRPMALPIGILMVGTGGILLFIGFHNLPSDVTNITDLMRFLREKSAAVAGAGP